MKTIGLAILSVGLMYIATFSEQSWGNVGMGIIALFAILATIMSAL